MKNHCANTNLYTSLPSMIYLFHLGRLRLVGQFCKKWSKGNSRGATNKPPPLQRFRQLMAAASSKLLFSKSKTVLHNRQDLPSLSLCSTIAIVLDIKLQSFKQCTNMTGRRFKRRKIYQWWKVSKSQPNI